MKKTVSLVRLLPLLAVLLTIACAAEPTPVLSTPIATRPPTARAQGTVSAGPTQPASTPASSPVAPTRSGPFGSVVIAGVGAPSRELTTLPDFVSNALYDSLLKVDPASGDLIPGLAERWLVSEDAKTFVFMLREDVEWHDGTPLTADDIVFTLQTLSNPDMRGLPAADFGPIQEIAAPDTRTVSVTFEEAYCGALAYIGQVNILPKHKLEDKPLTAIANEDFIGTGPLVLKAWDGDNITFARNPDYWGGATQIVDWTYTAFPTDDAAREAVREGHANVWIAETEQAGANSTVFPANEFYALALNTSRPPLDDVGTRQAIAAALDKTQFLDAIPGAVELETSLLPEYWAFPSNLSPQAFNAGRARQLLAQAGWRDTDADGILEKDGKPFEVTLWGRADDPRSEAAAQLARAQLEEVGIRAILKMTDRTLFLTRLFLQEYDLALAHFNIPLDPDQHYFWSTEEDDPGFGLNVTGYSNASVDAALEAGNQTARCDATVRKNAYAPVFRQLAQDVPMVFLFAPPYAVNTDGSFEGIEPSSFAGAYWNLNAWQVAP